MKYIKTLNRIWNYGITLIGVSDTIWLRELSKGLSWSFFGNMVGSLVLFIFNIVMARLIGPLEYGKYNLVLTLSNLAVVFMFFGVDTTVIKYLSQCKNSKKISKYISNSFIIFIFFGCIIFAIGFLLRNFIARVVNTNTELVVLSFIFSIIIGTKLLFEAISKGLHYFKYQSLLKILEVVLICIIFFVFFNIFTNLNYKFAIYILIGSYVFILIRHIFKYKQYFFKWDNNTFFQTKKYMVTVMGGSIIAIILGSIDKLYLNKFIGSNELGIYSAYLFASSVITTQIAQVIGGVLFPMINRLGNKRKIVSKMDKIIIILFTPFIIIFSIFSYGILYLFGSNYPIIIGYILLFTFISFFQFVFMVYSNIVVSIESLYSKYVRFLIFKPILVVCCYLFIYCIYRGSFFSIILATLLFSIYDLFITRFILLKRYVNEQ